jgi:hypothetical protein
MVFKGMVYHTAKFPFCHCRFVEPVLANSVEAEDAPTQMDGRCRGIGRRPSGAAGEIVLPIHDGGYHQASIWMPHVQPLVSFT